MIGGSFLGGAGGSYIVAAHSANNNMNTNTSGNSMMVSGGAMSLVSSSSLSIMASSIPEHGNNIVYPQNSFPTEETLRKSPAPLPSRALPLDFGKGEKLPSPARFLSVAADVNVKMSSNYEKKGLDSVGVDKGETIANSTSTSGTVQSLSGVGEDVSKDFNIDAPPVLKNRSSNAYKRKPWVPKHKRAAKANKASETKSETRNSPAAGG